MDNSGSGYFSLSSSLSQSSSGTSDMLVLALITSNSKLKHVDISNISLVSCLQGFCKITV